MFGSFDEDSLSGCPFLSKREFVCLLKRTSEIAKDDKFLNPAETAIKVLGESFLEEG